jgi:uncharacterized protein (DUF1015 family)
VVEVGPFRALRPSSATAARVAALPYDVMDVAEARAMAAGNPDSFLHVSRPEIDLPSATDPYDDLVYSQGRRALDDFVGRGVLTADVAPTFSVYRQRRNDRTQTGVVGVVAVADYDAGRVRTHELTRPDKELDRVRHIDALDAQDEPVFLLEPGSAAVAAVVAAVVGGEPVADFRSDDGVEHTVWVVAEPDRITALTEAYAQLPELYVADGHHRIAAASRVAAQRGGTGGHQQLLAVMFPADQVEVLAYNRVVGLGDHSAAELLAAIAADFVVSAADGPVEPAHRHEFGLYAAGRWYAAALRPGRLGDTDARGRLAVAVLQDRVLGPLLGVGDPREDPRLRFVGGGRGSAELERLVDADDSQVAFSLHPTTVAELFAVADAGEVMPPKSTWFEPKLRSGLFVHPFAP